MAQEEKYEVYGKANLPTIEPVGEYGWFIPYRKSDESEAKWRKMFEEDGFIDDPITDEEWAAMEKYPPVPVAEYQEIEKQAFRDMVKAIEARPGYPWYIGDAVMDKYIDAVQDCIVAAINFRKVLPFEFCRGEQFDFIPKNRRKIEGDYVVVAKEVIDMEV